MAEFTVIDDGLADDEFYTWILGKESKCKWKDKNIRPPDQCIVASNGNKSYVIDHIGPILDYWMSSGFGDSSFDGLPPGIWLVKVSIHCHHFNSPSFGYDYDESLEYYDQRMLTDKEVENFYTESIWNPEDYYDILEKLPED
jgi:hypothetical protein